MMPDLLVYLLKLNGALLLFVAVYYVLLRRLTFHTLNRWYLLGAVGFSALYPLVDVAALWPRPAALSEELTVLWVLDWSTGAVSAPNPAPVNYYGWLVTLYWAGVAVLGGQLGVQALSLWRLHRHSRPASNGRPFREVAEVMTPFSFWQTIYLNPRHHSPGELLAILLHEQVHVRQWHTVDVLLGQLQRVFGWFSPAAWLLLRAMQENLEFIADHAVLQAGQVGSKEYQYSLVRLSTLAQGPALVLPFSFITLKTRITMINKPQSARWRAAAYLLTVPLMAVAFCLNALNGQAQTSIARTSAPSASPAASMKVKTADGRLPIYYVDGVLTSDAALAALDPKDIEAMQVIKNEGANAFGPAGANGVVLITTKKNKDSPALKAFHEKYNITYAPANPEAKKITISVADGKGLSAADMQGRLLLINGKEATAEAAKIEASRIESVYVLDAKKAAEKYGDKGKNGAIIIITK